MTSLAAKLYVGDFRAKNSSAVFSLHFVESD